MKKLILLGIVVAAAWYGWKNPQVLKRQPSHEVVVENAGTVDLERVRVTVDGQTLVKEVVPLNGKAVMPFRVNNDASFSVVWQWRGRIGDHVWNGGSVPRGPLVQRHVIRIDDDDAVMYHAENK